LKSRIAAPSANIVESQSRRNREPGIDDAEAPVRKCVKWKLAKSSPMTHAKLHKENNGRVRFLTQEEAGRVLMACNIDFRIVVLAAMMTGFRRSELRSLRWTNIAFLNGSITIESSYS
jgi:integrase